MHRRSRLKGNNGRHQLFWASGGQRGAKEKEDKHKQGFVEVDERFVKMRHCVGLAELCVSYQNKLLLGEAAGVGNGMHREGTVKHLRGRCQKNSREPVYPLPLD